MTGSNQTILGLKCEANAAYKQTAEGLKSDYFRIEINMLLHLKMEPL